MSSIKNADATTPFNKAVTISLSMILSLVLSGFFALSAAARQLDAPDSIQSFPVGSIPLGVAFDGASIWVANEGSATLSKLRASDGASQGTFNVGSGPVYLVFDGASIWVTNSGEADVVKLRPSDGTIQGRFPVGNGPYGIAFDGAKIWVAS